MKLFLTSIFCFSLLNAQEIQEFKSIHQRESELHRSTAQQIESSSNNPLLTAAVPKTAVLSKKVFGYHPYWASSSAYTTYDYTALSHIGYFSYEVDTASGCALTTNGWATTPIISYAHARGVKVVLVVTNFGSSSNAAILGDTVKQNTLISTLLSLLISARGDGINLDFEAVGSSQRTNMVKFVQKLSAQMKTAVSGSELSMATPAVDWSSAWDFPSLAQACDYLVVMGYDYYWSGSTTAGPVAPLEGETYNVTRSVNTYLSAGVPANKLLLGVPWYGLDWPVQSNARKAPASGTAKSGLYKNLEPAALLNGKIFDATTKVPWFSYQSGAQWRQVWYDDSTSLSLKNSLVNAKNLGGIGIWALSYERKELWDGIRTNFPTPVAARTLSLPEEFRLEQNYPNPFNPATEIRYSVAAENLITLDVYDMLGRNVAELVHAVQPRGTYAVSFDAKGLSSGMYFYRIQSGNFSAAKRMVIVR